MALTAGSAKEERKEYHGLCTAFSSASFRSRLPSGVRAWRWLFPSHHLSLVTLCWFISRVQALLLPGRLARRRKGGSISRARVMGFWALVYSEPATGISLHELIRLPATRRCHLIERSTSSLPTAQYINSPTSRPLGCVVPALASSPGLFGWRDGGYPGTRKVRRYSVSWGTSFSGVVAGRVKSVWPGF